MRTLEYSPPAGFYVTGFPPRPSGQGVADFYGMLAQQSATLATLPRTFTMRRAGGSNAGIVAHEAFGDPRLVLRIMSEFTVVSRDGPANRVTMNTASWGALRIRVARETFSALHTVADSPDASGQSGSRMVAQPAEAVVAAEQALTTAVRVAAIDANAEGPGGYRYSGPVKEVDGLAEDGEGEAVVAEVLQENSIRSLPPASDSAADAIEATVGSIMNECYTFEAGPQHVGGTCQICKEEYRMGEQLILLPCAHSSHASHFEQWVQFSLEKRQANLLPAQQGCGGVAGDYAWSSTGQQPGSDPNRYR